MAEKPGFETNTFCLDSQLLLLWDPPHSDLCCFDDSALCSVTVKFSSSLEDRRGKLRYVYCGWSSNDPQLCWKRSFLFHFWVLKLLNWSLFCRFVCVFLASSSCCAASFSSGPLCLVQIRYYLTTSHQHFLPLFKPCFPLVLCVEGSIKSSGYP